MRSTVLPEATAGSGIQAHVGGSTASNVDLASTISERLPIVVATVLALSFLLGFNDTEFNIQIRASEYYGFFVLTLIGVGLLFQIPIGVLAVTRLGIVTPQQLSHNRRYAVLAIAVVAMLLPGTDPVTMLICMLPLYLLFEFSLLLARWFGTPGDADEGT